MFSYVSCHTISDVFQFKREAIFITMAVGLKKKKHCAHMGGHVINKAKAYSVK